MKFTSSSELRRYVKAKHGPKVVLSFSGGKDAVGSWLALRDDGFEVHPYFLYLVPDLSFVEETLSYYERFFGTKIMRLPHPSLFRLLDNLVYQPPERVCMLERAEFPRQLDYEGLYWYTREKFGCPDAPVAVGVRETDSLMRRISIKTHGPISERKGQFFPIYDWKNADLVAALRRNKCRLSHEYRVWGRSFDGIDWHFLKPLKEHYPEDYAKVLKWFPLAELSLLQRESLYA
jgi:hypothetical protein